MNNLERKYKILIVDDVPENIQVLGNVLIREGKEVSYATTGEQALRIVAHKQPDLILLDIMMPDIDGYEICGQLKQNPLTKEIPIIFLTARNQTEHVIKGFQMGANDYITKPFNCDELSARVNTHLDLKVKSERLKLMNIELEHIVAERTKELNIAKQQLEKLDKAKSDFLNLISHELRTPLNGIVGFSQILKDSAMSSQQVEFIKEINKAAFRLVTLSDLALLITSLRAERYKIRTQPILIRSIIDELKQKISEKSRMLNIQIISKLHQENLYISIDKGLMNSCLEIVLDNAIAHSPANDAVIISAFPEEGGVAIEITDNGPGFTPKALKELFNFFVTEDIDYHSQGFGLGLATAKLIMDTLSGSIAVNNKESGGAIVKLYFRDLTFDI